MAVDSRSVGHSAGLELMMVRYQQADPTAPDELVKSLSPLLMRFFSGPDVTRPYAEDLLQEFFLRLHKARASYRVGSPLLPWVLAIARYVRADAYRRMRRIEFVDQSLLDELPALEPLQSEPFSRSELWDLVARLPPGQQEVIRLVKITGLSMDETARCTGSTVAAVKQKAYRAYEKLRCMARQAPQWTGGGSQHRPARCS